MERVLLENDDQDIILLLMDPSPQFPTGNDRLSVARGLILMGSLNLDPSICRKKK